MNISLDSLDADRFARMTRGGKLDGVMRGIDAALAAGFDEIKLNAVVVRGENDAELEELVRWSWARGIIPRLLEVMAIGEGAKLSDRVVSANEMRARLAHLLESGEAIGEANRGPAKYLYARHDPSKKVGFITGASDTFCKGCDRLRVASDGMLRPCLATNDGLAAGEIARSGDARRRGDCRGPTRGRSSPTVRSGRAARKTRLRTSRCAASGAESRATPVSRTGGSHDLSSLAHVNGRARSLHRPAESHDL